MALNAYVVRHAPHLSNPMQPTDENLLAGLNVFRDACAGCHGDPNSRSDYGASVYPHVPQFTFNPPRLPDWQTFWIVKNLGEVFGDVCLGRTVASRQGSVG